MIFFRNYIDTIDNKVVRLSHKYACKVDITNSFERKGTEKHNLKHSSVLELYFYRKPCMCFVFHHYSLKKSTINLYHS